MTAASTGIAEPTPAAPTAVSGERIGLVVREFSCDVCAPGVGTVVLTDGRVIWQSSSGLWVRQLDELGLAQVRAGLATPALERSARYDATVRPGASPPAFGPESHRFQLERAGIRIDVSAGDAPTFAGWPGMFDIPDEAIALSALASRMHDPETWIGADRWATPAAPYLPDRYLVIVTRHRGEPAPASVDIDAVAWPFGSVDAIGAPYRPGSDASIEEDSRCLAVSAETARAMATAETNAGATRDLGRYFDEATYTWRRVGGSISVTTRALLPYQPADCSDAVAW